MNCISCGKKVEGRSDKIYCDAYCKSNYHYQKRKDKDHATFFKKVDLQLKTNRKILKHFSVDGYSAVRRQLLFDKGFDPNFFTHYWKNKKEDVYLFCYDIGFLAINQKGVKKYLLVNWQPFMENVKS